MTEEEARWFVRRLSPAEIRGAAAGLAALLVDCVEGGASVSFMAGLDEARAQRFWMEIAAAAESDGRAVIIAQERDGRVLGTVQMIPAPYENQPHRAEIAKMLVLRAARRRGLGAALMRAAEAAAREAGKTLLTLDTASPEAERLYARLGWTAIGRIPDYALMPDGAPCATTIFYKALAASMLA
jgi:GNAT superfamily N-acetyltransferase